MNTTILVFRAAVIPRLEIFNHVMDLCKPTQIHISELGNPSFFCPHGATIERASLSNAKMFVAVSSEPIVEIAIRIGTAGEGTAGWKVSSTPNMSTYNVDCDCVGQVIGKREALGSPSFCHSFLTYVNDPSTPKEEPTRLRLDGTTLSAVFCIHRLGAIASDDGRNMHRRRPAL